MDKKSTRQLGAAAETAVCRWLEKHGYRIVAQNVYVGRAEIDIIVEDGEYLVFVEVKSRAVAAYNEKYGRPSASIGIRKQQLLLAAANEYLRANPTSLQPRMDIVEVLTEVRDGREVYDIRHYTNAIHAKRRHNDDYTSG